MHNLNLKLQLLEYYIIRIKADKFQLKIKMFKKTKWLYIEDNCK